MRAIRFLLGLLMFSGVATALAGDANRLTYLDEVNPYYVSRTFPKLVTPQWVGEDGVEAVVILAIDDMRGHQNWERFLRPIIERLKRIDGHAPVSIMTCQIDPKEPHLQKWLSEDLSLEIHTIDHPCPLLARGDLARAKSTYDRCVDLLYDVPENIPVAFRMPCCDSLNTLSPRFFTEIFNQRTPRGHFLRADSSVFNVLTSDDPALPRNLVIDPDGQEKFRKYLPLDRSFVNTIENYPYPYVIGHTCWEFPCITPSDWQGNHLHQSNNPITVRDWKAALDATVLKQGVFTMVFHPHGWIKNDQIIELIDYAVTKFGKKVKFLTFADAIRRLEDILLRGWGLRNSSGNDAGRRLVDLNNDGYLDVVDGQRLTTSVWVPGEKTWRHGKFPTSIRDRATSGLTLDHGIRFGIFRPDGHASFLGQSETWSGAYHFDGKDWVEDRTMLQGLELNGQRILTQKNGRDTGVRLRDLDHDGRCELIVSNPQQQAVFQWSETARRWQRLPFALPARATIVDGQGRDGGVRFVDIDEDGRDDVIVSNESGYGLYLFSDLRTGWSRKVVDGPRGTPGELPMITRNGTNNGAWFHSRHLWVQNEDTALLKDHVDRRSLNDLLQSVEPMARSPEASLHSIQTRPGFTVELMAAEPLVRDPIAFAWGPDGKFWVVEMGDYPLGEDGKGKPGGRIKYLEDTDGDGKYDKATLFLDGLSFPTGVMPWGRGVIVSCAPEIFYAEDTDGDGKADVRRPLFVGFTEGNPQHRVNGLVWGLDNWIYGANGDSGGHVRSTKTASAIELRGRDFRFRPNEGLIDAQSGQTQFGRNRDDWGNWFGCNNSNPLWHFVLADHYLRRNPDAASPDPRRNVSVTPGASPVYPISRTLPRFNDLWAANHFTSACSAIIYRDDLFGPPLAGNTFVSEPVHNLVHREVMQSDGVSFRSRRAPDEQHSEFLASSDNWFRPTSIGTGPDGALWIADMYRAVIEHPEWIPKDWQARLDLRAGHDLGRIYRVYPLDRRPRPIPRLDRLDAAGLVAALDSPNGWQRDLVQQMLLWRHDRAAIPLLEKQVLDHPRPLTRLHALCTLDGLDALSPAVLAKALRDAHAGVRRHTVRLTENANRQTADVRTALLERLDDPDPQVRLQLACTLGEWHDPAAARALGQLALRDGNDPYHVAAILSSVNASSLQAVLLAVLSQSGRQAPPPALTENLMRLALKQQGPTVLGDLLERLATPAPHGFERWQLAGVAGLFDALEARNQSLSQWMRPGGPAPENVRHRLEQLLQQARKLVASGETPLETRLAAIRLLGRWSEGRNEDRQVLEPLLAPQCREELQAAAVAAFGHLPGAEAAAILLLGWKSFGPALRSQVLDVLFQRPAGLEAVLGALENKRILPLEIDAVHRQRLFQHRTAAVRERAARLFTGSIDSDRQKIIDAYATVLTMQGDTQRGQQLFTKTCSTCHVLGGIGHAVGPDLASLGDKSPQALLVAILDPNRAVEARYLNYVAMTRNGQTFTGVLTSETGNSVTLVGPEGKTQVILRADLEELASTNKSAMPEGLEKDLTPKDLADVIAFVRSGEPPVARKVFDGNRPELIKAEPNGTFRLAASNCAIYGRTLIFEPQYGNLGYWMSDDDRAVWTIDVSQAGTYDIWLDWACPDQQSGKAVAIQAGGRTWTGVVASTGGWDTYRQARVGDLVLNAGRQEIEVRAAAKIREPLFDLRSIRLVPRTK